MRRLLVVLTILVASGCSSAETSSQSSEARASETPSDSAADAPSSSPSASPTSVGLDPCELLSAADVTRIVGGAVGEAEPGLTGGLPNCQWPASQGRFVQTMGAEASEWARSLPDLIRMIEASGQVKDADNLQKLRKAARLVEAGEDLDAEKACGLFSEMLTLQGQPPGSQSIATVFPSREDPEMVTAQMCSGGRFTSVMLASTAGLETPLPLRQVAQAMRIAHRRSLR